MQSDEPPGQAGEAARYAVLRRIGPALRHDLVVNLQALAMMTEVVGARLDRGTPPREELQDDLARLQRVTREAVADALRVATWLAPSEDDRIDLREGIGECLALVRSALEYRGFSLRSELPAAGFDVSRTALRSLLLAAVIHLSDQAGAPGELLVDARTGGERAELALRHLGTGHAQDGQADAAYRRVRAGDVQALAADAAADIDVQDGAIRIGLARLVPTTPLQIAPL